MCTKDTRRKNVQFWEKKKGQGYMKAFLILEDGTVFQGTSIGSAREIISEIVFNTSMTGYLEVLTLLKYDIPGIAGIDTRTLTRILRNKGAMNGMVTTNENYNIEEILPKLKAYETGDVVSKVTCGEKSVLEGEGKKLP